MAGFFDNLFGWSLKNKEPEQTLPSFVPPRTDDGAVVVAAGGSYGTYVDLEGTSRTEADLVTRYREMAQYPEVNSAVDDIVNEAIVTSEDYIVKIDLDNIEGLSAGTRQKITGEFEEVLNLLDFGNMGFETFKRWYIDGRLYYHVIIDEQNQKNGIQELRYIDPRKIKKIREVEQVQMNGYTLQQVKAEYYIYNDRTFTSAYGQPLIATDASAVGLRILPDAILHCTSGVLDTNGQLVLSHLHQAIRQLNQLRTLEDAALIYRISRAPEKRIFYIDVSGLPRGKAEQHLRETMVRHKNRLVYDATTGEVRDDRKFMTMMEDYWFPRRSDGKATEVTTLPPGQLNQTMDLEEYFKQNLYKALNVPISRMNPDIGMTLGRASEISRDEVKFSKFVDRLRKRFCMLFLKALHKQLLMKGIIDDADWPMLSRMIKFVFAEDNHFAELKDQEILSNRAATAQQLEPYIGRYFSNEWIRKNVFMQTEDEMELNDEQIAMEVDIPQYMQMPLDPSQDPEVDPTIQMEDPASPPNRRQ